MLSPRLDFPETSPPFPGVSLALWARNAEKSLGASCPGSQRSLQKASGTVWEVSRESPEVSAESSWTVPGLLETFSGFSGHRPRETFSKTFSHFERPLYRVRKISPKFSCIKFFQIRDVPTQIPGHPGHSLSKTTEKGHLHKVFVRDIPTSGSRMSQEYPAQKLYVYESLPKGARKMVPREKCRKVSKNFLTLFDDF